LGERRRRDLNLVDQGDILQSEAAVLSLEQNLESSRRISRDLQRQVEIFWGRRFEDGSSIALETLKVEKSQIPSQSEFVVENRADYLAADRLASAGISEAQLLRSKVEPELSLFGSLQFSGFESGFSEAEKEIFESSYPRYSLGLELQVPLDFGKVSRLRKAGDHLKQSREFERSKIRQSLERDFLNLQDRVQELEARLATQERLIETQRQKLKNEDGRFRQGRSSSFQMLSFEEDLAGSELQALELYADLRLVLAELQLFESPL
jgi:outer membrane protein TolC